MPASSALLPTVPQLLTNDASDFAIVAAKLAAAGCREVNWNLGCPHLPVIAAERGAGLLPHPDRIAAILDEVVPRLELRLSVKMRLGPR